MTSDVRESLFQALAQLSSLYPEMRFGQLIEFACALAGVEAPADLDEVEDEVLMTASRKHVRKRSRLLGVQKRGRATGLGAKRAELLEVLRELADWQPHRRFGHLVARIVELAQANLYDVEDEQLVHAVRTHRELKVTA